MATKPKSFSPRGMPTTAEREREYDRQRDRHEWRQWYKSPRWRAERADFLSQPENQFCKRCLALGFLNAGQLGKDGQPQTKRHRMHLVVHHTVRHRGDAILFWDRSKWEPICPDHHDSDAQAEEKAQNRPF